MIRREVRCSSWLRSASHTWASSFERRSAAPARKLRRPKRPKRGPKRRWSTSARPSGLSPSPWRPSASSWESSLPTGYSSPVRRCSWRRPRAGSWTFAASISRDTGPETRTEPDSGSDQQEHRQERNDRQHRQEDGGVVLGGAGARKPGGVALAADRFSPRHGSPTSDASVVKTPHIRSVPLLTRDTYELRRPGPRRQDRRVQQLSRTWPE